MSYKSGTYIKFRARGGPIDVGRVVTAGVVQAVVEQWHSLESCRVRIEDVIGEASRDETLDYLRSKIANLRKLAQYYTQAADDLEKTIAEPPNDE